MSIKCPARPNLESMPLTAPVRDPLRPSASAALWAHLLRKDVSTLPLDASTNDPLPLPPLTPMDKNGTAMRILLHDTSHNLEKFSERVDKLISGVGETRKEVVDVHKRFHTGHEELRDEMADLGQ
jgi:hypothetical protein